MNDKDEWGNRSPGVYHPPPPPEPSRLLRFAVTFFFCLGAVCLYMAIASAVYLVLT